MAQDTIKLDVRNAKGSHIGDQESPADADGIARTISGIAAAMNAFRQVGVPGFGIVEINGHRKSGDFGWLNKHGFVNGDFDALVAALRFRRIESAS